MLVESVKNQVKILTDARLQSEQQRKLTEENCIRLQTELDVLKRDLDERQNDLKKERMRIEKFIRQEEVILPSFILLIFLSSSEFSIKRKISHGKQRTNHSSISIIEKSISSTESFTKRLSRIIRRNERIKIECYSSFE